MAEAPALSSNTRDVLSRSDLLTTKLNIPPPRPNLVPRPSLAERLTAGATHLLTLISALAGSGKSTLVSDWLRQSGQPAAWLSLDEADNEFIRFWTYVIAALQTVHPHLGQTALAALQSPGFGNLATSLPIEKLLTSLINDLAALSDQLILVIDDYHLIETAEIHQSLNFLLDHLPTQLHLVIITREDPPLPLPRLRVRRQMTELRGTELRFTTAEAAQFLNQTMGLELRPEDIDVLEQRTEGWVAGLQLAALSMQTLADSTHFIKAFSGDDHYIVDYLIVEVLDHQPEPIRQFLLQTAILQRLTAPLCDAVTGKKNGQQVLSHLGQANLFLIALDNRREWYRYHHLFRDLLGYQLGQAVSEAEIKQLHQRAAAWYAQHGFTDEAIHHALAAEDVNRAADLIEAAWSKLVGQGQLTRLLGWLEKLPDEFVRTRPLLCLGHAWILTLTGQFTTLELRLQDTERALSNAPPALTKDIEGQLATLHAYLDRHQGQIDLALAHLHQALADCAPDNLWVRCIANLNLGFNYWLSGEFSLAQPALHAARTNGQSIQAVYAILVAMAIQGDIYLAQGKLGQAARLYEEGIAFGLAHNGGQPFPPAGYAYAGLGRVLYERNELEQAKGYLAQAVELGELLADGTIIRRGIFFLAHLAQLAGDKAAAQTLWQRAQTAQDTVEAGQVMVHQVRSWLAQAAAASPQSPELAQAARWAESYRRSQPDASSSQAALAQMTLAWVELAQGQAQQALARLTPLAEAAATAEQIHHLINILALQALAFAAEDDAEAALAALKRVLDLAAPEGYIRTFVDYGQPMQQLLQQATRQGLAPDYVPKLLAAFPDLSLATNDLREDTHTVDPKSEIVNLVEPLNEREIAILRLMAAGLSNQAIAGELYLSLNTVKWYARHIFSKLAVNKRTQAVARAQELGIL
jgi:LuxR family maltose regulon positive regulatory protein